MANPRRSNGARRNAILKWLRAQAMPCWICGLPIDYGLPARHPLSFECDELVPVSKGGSPYARDNVAASHRCCNGWRSARSTASVEQMKARVAAAFGGWSSPEEFVARARAVSRAEKHAAKPGAWVVETTTEW